MPTAAAQRARFASTAVSTASPQTLLVMLYGRLVLDLQRAEESQRSSEHGAANRHLQHAQDIVTELALALDTDAWPDGKGLAGLYAWLQTEMVQANITRDPERTSGCRALVEPLADAWRQAAAGTAPAAAPVVAGLLGGTA